MSKNFGSHFTVGAAAVGAGVLVGALGFFLYEKLFSEKRRMVLQDEVVSLNRLVSEMRGELQMLRSNQQKKIKSRNYVDSVHETSGRSDAETEMMSALDDDFEDEFFDLSDSDEEILSLETAKRDFEGDKYADIDFMLGGNLQNKTKAYGLLLDLYEQDNMNPELLWRMAKACHFMADICEEQKDTEKQQYYLNLGVEHATKCLELAPRSSDAHKWYAVCIGTRGKLKGSREKIKDGLEFKKHVEEALSISPEDPTLHHLLGRFQFEVSTLSWIERKLANALYGEVPTSTISEAIESLQRAENYSTEPWKENRLILAKCYLAMDEYPIAVEWLEKAEEVESISPEDHVADSEIKALRNKFGAS